MTSKTAKNIVKKAKKKIKLEEEGIVEFTNCQPKEFLCHIKGIRPLLFSKFPDFDAKKPRKGEITDPKDIAKQCLYLDKKGKIYLPAEHLEGALIQGGKGWQIPGEGKATYTKEIAQNIIVIPQNVPFLFPEDPKDYTIDKRVVVANGKARMWSFRPRWDEWEFKFTIRYECSFGVKINRNVLVELLQRAGKYGVGTYRLKFGKFMPVSVTEVTSK